MPIRAAVYSDLPAILEIYNESVQNSTASYDLEPRDMAAQLRWFENHRAGAYPIIVAIHWRKVVGWASLSPFHSRPGYGHTVEDSIYVASRNRGKGYGSSLLNALLQEANTKYHVVMALIDGDNKASIHIHEKAGFKNVGVMREVGRKFDRWLDVVIMRRPAHPEIPGVEAVKTNP